MIGMKYFVCARGIFKAPLQVTFPECLDGSGTLAHCKENVLCRGALLCSDIGLFQCWPPLCIDKRFIVDMLNNGNFL